MIEKNNNKINVSGQGNSGMFLKTAVLGDVITNATGGSINVSEDKNIGMRMDVGTFVGTGAPTGKNEGTIKITSGTQNIGMLANGKNSIGAVQAKNNVNITITGGTKNNAMSSVNGGNIENTGNINILSPVTNSIGMYIENTSTGIGTGNITVTGDENTAIANFGTFTQTGGTIDASGKDSIGVYAKDSTSDTLIKSSTVNAKNGAVAFYADGSSGNESTIKIDGTTSDIGDGGLLFFNYTGTGVAQVGKFNILSPTTANILSGGVAFYNRGNIGSEANFLNMINGNGLTLNMSSGSRLFVFDDPGIIQNLSSIPSPTGVSSLSNSSGF